MPVEEVLKFESPPDGVGTATPTGTPITYTMQGVFLADTNDFLKFFNNKTRPVYTFQNNVFEEFVMNQKYTLSGRFLEAPVNAKHIFSDARPILFQMGNQMGNRYVKIVSCNSPTAIQPSQIFVQMAKELDFRKYNTALANNKFENNRGGKRQRRTKRGRRMKLKSRFRRSRRF